MCCRALIILASGILFMGAADARGDVFGFGGLTNNSLIDTAIAEAQLGLEVTASGTQALFKFYNVGPEASSITDVYFDDDTGSLMGISSLIDADDGVGGDSGVDFSLGGSPPDLPGGNAVNFQVTAGFLADADSRVQHNGVNPGEYLGIIFDLHSSAGAMEMFEGLMNGTLRVGIHVQGFDSGGSESLINNETAHAPLPGAVVLGALGLGCVQFVRRRLSTDSGQEDQISE
jgi:hypothetical protein